MEKGRKAIKLIYVGEILALIALIASSIGGNFLSSAVSSYAEGTTEAGTVIGGTVLAGISGVLAIVGSIIRLVGIIKGKGSSKYLNIAFLFTLLVFVMALINTFAPSDYLGSKVSKASDMLDLVISCSVIYGVVDLAVAAGNSSLADAARNTGHYFLIIAIVAIFSDYIPTFLSSGGTVAVILGIAYIVLVIVAYIMYLRLLRKAAKEL